MNEYSVVQEQNLSFVRDYFHASAWAEGLAVIIKSLRHYVDADEDYLI